MERMLVVVFDNQKRAYEGKAALRQLQVESNITVYDGAVVIKHADGTASVDGFDDSGPIGALTGTAVGSLIGLLGGPPGVALGAASGLALGGLFDVDNLDNACVGRDFVGDVSKSLTPNKVALIAEVDEEWTAPVDTRMEALGGTVFRRSMWEARQKFHDEEIAAMNADVAQFKAEFAKADAERRAKLQKEIDQLQARIEGQQKKANDRREAFESRQKSKRDVLKKNVAAAGRALKDLATTPI